MVHNKIHTYIFNAFDEILPFVIGTLFATCFFLIPSEEVFALSSEDRIRAVRESSNAALKALDEDTNFEFLTDSVLIATGNGTLLSGINMRRSGFINPENGKLNPNFL